MKNAVGRIEFPELFFGIVAPVGADTGPTINAIAAYAKRANYRVIPIKVTDYFANISHAIEPRRPLNKHPTDERMESYIDYGNQIREFFDDDPVLAAYTILKDIQGTIKDS